MLLSSIMFDCALPTAWSLSKYRAACCRSQPLAPAFPPHASLDLQDKPYAFFGTCLGAITAYEAIHAIQRHGTGPLPLAFFPAAVSPPHVYAQAVAQLYVAPGEPAAPGEGLMAGVLQKLRGWRDLPRELVMQVGSAGNMYMCGCTDVLSGMHVVGHVFLAKMCLHELCQQSAGAALICLDLRGSCGVPAAYWLMAPWQVHPCTLSRGSLLAQACADLSH